MAAALTAAAVAGCGGEDSDGDAADTVATGASANRPSGGPPRLTKIGDFDQPTFVAQPPGSDDLYVVEKPGRVKLVRGSEVSTALDISDEVSDTSEQGLLSIAFDPDGGERVYAYYTDSAEDQRVVEFRLGEDGAIDAGSRRELLRMDDFASNHNGGLLLFGPDRHLYIGTGDGGGAGDPERNGQDLGSLLGKILRIDPRPSSTAAANSAAERRPYSIPDDNPFTGRAGARPEIFAFGLRNPWRFSFDPGAGTILIADVGQDSLEEVNVVPRGRASGGNFGWSAFEGTERFNDDQQAPGAIAPVLTYGRDLGCSITGGYVVADPDLPTLRGRYVYGDFCTGELRSFRPAPSGARDDRPLGLEVPQLSSFALDDEGSVYATSLAGSVYRLDSE
jgi:glucose/arabinose dehydrogenase